ncbi:MAG TPA: hypothetical protein VF169_21985, partial [Albitalea sp.]|uniref:hypothetical protein n=1 Tax=Piscinibacter sp. TaxID=1903157 RepID=UPI002ED0C09E
GGGSAYLYKESTNSWSTLATGLSMGPYHNIAIYNPVHKIVLFGGGNGSNQLYKINASGQVSAIANAPADIGILQSVFTADPASGKYLLFTSSGGFFEYDVAGNRWSTLSASNVAMFNGGSNRIMWRIAIPISTYGVIAFLAEGGTTDTKVLLYRHASTGSTPVDVTPPTAPGGLTVK